MTKPTLTRTPYDPGKAARERFKTSEPVRAALTQAQRRGVRIGLRPDPSLMTDSAALGDSPEMDADAAPRAAAAPKSSPKPARLKPDDPGKK